MQILQATICLACKYFSKAGFKAAYLNKYIVFKN